MIQFKCSCGKSFEFPESRAGDSLQCPKCFRLVDVPLLGDIDAFDADGTVKMSEAAALPTDLGGKMRAFGHHADQRQSVEDYLAMDDLAPADQAPTRLPPRYDPVTGELLETIDLRDEPVNAVRPQDIPMATPTLAYASTPSAPPEVQVRWWTAPLQILSGSSLMAVGFVFAAHVAVHLFLLMPGIRFLLAPFTVLLVVAIATHYLNVIDEFGPHRRDVVPTLFRRVSLSEDILHPAFSLLVAGLFSYGPILLAMMVGLAPVMHSHPWILATLLIWGTFVFPAAVLTATTSGSLPNMLPHRVLSVIRHAPFLYLLVLIPLVIGMLAYALILPRLLPLGMGAYYIPLTQISWKIIVLSVATVYLLMLVATYCTHLAAVWLGLIYRTRHEEFNWVYQQHQKRPRDDTLARLQEMRRQGDPRLHRRPAAPRQPAPQPAQPVRRPR